MSQEIQTATYPTEEENANSEVSKMEHLQLYGIPKSEQEKLPAPHPECVQRAIEQIFDDITGVLSNTFLEQDIEGILWGIINVFHHKVGKLENEVHDNCQEQKNLMEVFDGSEIKDVELQNLKEKGEILTERLAAFEDLRNYAAEKFAVETGTPWMPLRRSTVSNRNLTASVIDSREFINAVKLQKTERLIPKGTKIVVTGSQKYENHHKIFAVLDNVKEKYPDLVLFHGGAKGADTIAAAWAKNRGVPQIVFKPDWQKHRKAAGFKRNDLMLEQMPKGILIFSPDSGGHEQLMRNAKAKGIAVALYK